MKLLELRPKRTFSLMLGAIALLLISPVAHAKRGPEPIVLPIQANGIEFRAPNTPETEGVIEAWEPTSNRLLWSKRVYRTLKNPLAEEDVQWVFIKSLCLGANNQELIITDERGRSHSITINPPLVGWPILLGSTKLSIVLIIVWAIIGCVLAIRCGSGAKVYWMSVLLALPCVAVSQYEYELLPMGGIVHALAAGLYPLTLFWIVQAVRLKRRHFGGDAPSKNKSNGHGPNTM